MSIKSEKAEGQKSAGGGAVAKKLVPFGGYYTNKVPGHDPELTETGPGTPMGEYMRAFWHPVCMSIELTDTPRYLKILGEELVAFRDGSGRVGVLHAHCVHRGASLEYGAIQEHGIKCCYHGMVFDVDGTCLHVPFPNGEEKEAEKYACSIQQGAYKAVERNGLVFAYMGPPDKEPPFAEWEGDFTVAPGDELVAYSNFQHCNWLQVQDNASLACAGARRVDKDRLFVRVQHQVLPNLSLHAYTSEDGSKKKLFSRFHIIRWTVPVDDENSKMIGWRVMGPGIDTRGICDKSLVGYESIDFLEGQVAMRRPERFGKYKLEDLPPIPPNHRERENYKDAQYAPGDYEAIISQRPIAVHALENPTKFDAGLFMFRKMLRDAVRGTNPAASADNFAEWFRANAGAPNSYCSGNVFDIPQGETVEQEVANRRNVTKRIVAILTESETLKGEERAAFVREKFDALEALIKS